MCEDATLDPDELRLETERLILRSLRAEDAAAICEQVGDPAVALMLTRVPYPYAIEDAREFIADHEGETVFAICRRTDGALIGCIGLREEGGAGAPPACELGYWLGRTHWGRGVATEAAQAVIDHGFEVMELDKIRVSCRVVNEASRRVIRKCGFQFVGAIMADTLCRGGVAAERYVLERDCWASLKSWGRRGVPQ